MDQHNIEKSEEFPIWLLDDEQPATCPKCGARTDFTDNPDGTQNHECLRCRFQFIGEFDNEEF